MPKRLRKIKIAFVGIRGIPACYSGFETFVEGFAGSLAEEGYEVTVYNRQYVNFKERKYNGIRIITLPTIERKHLDTFCHTFLCVIHTLFCRYDIVYFCGVGNSPFLFIPRLVSSRVIINVDGLDWTRQKWSLPAKNYLKICERLALIFAHIVLTDSKTVQRYYQNTYGRKITYIPYGIKLSEKTFSGEDVLQRFGLENKKYILFVGRLVPENGAHLLIDAFNCLKTDFKLVIAGGATYSDRYIHLLKSKSNPDIIFTGFIFGNGYTQLMSCAYLFVLPSMVSGTRMVLLEAMSFGNCVLTADCESNLEVIGDGGISYDSQNGARALQSTLQYLMDSSDTVKAYKIRAVERIRNNYSWKNMINEYSILLSKCTR